MYDAAAVHDPIVGNAVIVKSVDHELVMLSIMEAARIAHMLKQHRDQAIDYIRQNFNIVTEQA